MIWDAIVVIMTSMLRDGKVLKAKLVKAISIYAEAMQVMHYGTGRC